MANVKKNISGNKNTTGYTTNKRNKISGTKEKSLDSYPIFYSTMMAMNGINGINNSNIIFNPYLLESCYKGIVATCIDLKAKYAASAKAIMSEKISQTKDLPKKKHAFIKLMESPNRFMSGHNLLVDTYQKLEIYGNAYWYIPKGTMGLPAPWKQNGGITPLQNKFVKINYTKGIPSSYEYNTGTITETYTVDEIIHIKYNNPFHPFEGMSTIQKAYQQIAIDMDLRNYQSAQLQNGGLKKQAIKMKQKLSQKQLQDLQQQYMDANAGSKNQNKIMILGGDADMVNLVSTAQELDFIPSSKYYKNELMNILGVHIAMLDAENVNKANVEGAIVIFNHMCIRIMMDAVTSAISLYVKEVYKNDDLFLQFILETPEMPEYRLKQYQVGLQEGCIAPNEYREWMNYLPIDSNALPESTFDIPNKTKGTTNNNTDTSNTQPMTSLPDNTPTLDVPTDNTPDPNINPND